jgi:hypothetical protein
MGRVDILRLRLWLAAALAAVLAVGPASGAIARLAAATAAITFTDVTAAPASRSPTRTGRLGAFWYPAGPALPQWPAVEGWRSQTCVVSQQPQRHVPM